MYFTDQKSRYLQPVRRQHIALPTRDTFCKCMRGAVLAGEPLSKALRRASRDEMSAGGSPQTTPAPGDDYTAKAANFQPNAAGTINEQARSSTTAPTLNLGQTWGTKAELPTEETNAQGFQMGTAGSWSTDRRVYSQIVRPSRSTMDAAKADIQTREAAAVRSSATLADINRKNRAFKWGA
jgi:hypothetical protein